MAHTLDYANKPPNYKAYKKRAEKNFPDSEMISENEFSILSEQECHYCGKEGPNGIDRVDNLKGYISENCVPCCKHCNYVKGDLSIEDFNTWKQRFIRKQSV
jgi:hypothetical protein